MNPVFRVLTNVRRFWVRARGSETVERRRTEQARRGVGLEASRFLWRCDKLDILCRSRINVEVAVFFRPD